MKSPMKNLGALALAGSMIILVMSACNDGKGEKIVDTRVEKYSAGELVFGESEKELADAVKTSITVSGEYTYIGTKGKGIWAKKKGDLAFTQVAHIGQATIKNDQLNSKIENGDDLYIEKMKPFNGGVAAMVQNKGIVVIMDGEVFATFAMGDRGVPNKELIDFLVFENGEDKYLVLSTALETEGCAVRRLADDNSRMSKAFFPKGSKRGDGDNFGQVSQIALVGDNLIFFVELTQQYLEFPKEAFTPGAKAYIATKALDELDYFNKKELSVKGSAKPNDSIETLFGNRDVAFIGMQDGRGSPGGESSPDLGGVATKKGDVYIAPQVGGVWATDYFALGAKTLIVTDKGYMIANGADIGPLVNKASKLAVVPGGTKAQQASGFTSAVLPTDDFRAGALAADGTIYLISGEDGFKEKVFTVSTAVEMVKTSG